jgi:tRNA pseudouridine55 synthase
MDGLLVVDKPRGPTSFDVVRKVRGVVRRLTKTKKIKVGHVGTLDPFATGVLPLCIGRTTRFARFLIEGDKRYRATMRLGEVRTTDDTEGEIVEVSEGWKTLDEKQVRETLESLVGTQLQRPPIYSAIKIDGKCAYELARAGEIPEMVPREITIYSLEVERIELPDVQFTVASSKGTYIRAICRDVGAALGCGAHCHELRRLVAAGFDEAESVPMDLMLDADEDLFRSRLLSPAQMLRELPLVEVNSEASGRLRMGQMVEHENAYDAETMVRVLDKQDLVCVALVTRDGRIKPERVLS